MTCWNNRDYIAFVLYVKQFYNQSEEDIVRMLDYEIDRLTNFWKGKKRLTVKVKREIIDSALSNCRLWLSESLEEKINPHCLANNSVSKLYFNMLRKEENE